MITDEQLGNLTGEPVGIPKDSLGVSTFLPTWNPSFTDGEKFQRMQWDTDRIEKTKKDLHSKLMRGDIEPPSEEVLNTRLNEWWKFEGQNLPRFVLDEIGIVGGDKVPTTQERLTQAYQDENAKIEQKTQIVKEALGITDEPYDYLHDKIVADPDDDDTYKPPVRNKAPIFEKLRQFDDESVILMSDIVKRDILAFPPDVVKSVDREVQIREYKEKITDLIAESPEKATAVLIGTQFFNSLALNLPESLSRNGIDPTEERPGEKAALAEAARRIRTEIVSKNPTILNKISMNTGEIAADVIKFYALPDVGKLAMFDKLSSAVKGAIGIGTKSALIESLRASEEGETAGQRALKVGASGVTGATVGYAFGFAQDTVKSLLTKLKVNSTRNMLLGKATPEMQEYIKTLSPEQLQNMQAAVNDSFVWKSGAINTETFLGRHESFLNALGKDAADFMAKNFPPKTGLSRAGMAEIGGEVSKKVLKWAVDNGLPQGATAGAIRQAITTAVEKGVDVPVDVLEWNAGAVREAAPVLKQETGNEKIYSGGTAKDLKNYKVGYGEFGVDRQTEKPLGIYFSDSKEIAKTFGKEVLEANKPNASEILDLTSSDTPKKMFEKLGMSQDKIKNVLGFAYTKDAIDASYNNYWAGQYDHLENIFGQNKDLLNKIKEEYKGIKFLDKTGGKRHNSYVIFSPESLSSPSPQKPGTQGKEAKAVSDEAVSFVSKETGLKVIKNESPSNKYADELGNQVHFSDGKTVVETYLKETDKQIILMTVHAKPESDRTVTATKTGKGTAVLDALKKYADSTWKQLVIPEVTKSAYPYWSKIKYLEEGPVPIPFEGKMKGLPGTFFYNPKSLQSPGTPATLPPMTQGEASRDIAPQDNAGGKGTQGDVEQAKAMPKKAEPVQEIQPIKYVSPEQAGPFKITFKGKGDLPATKIITNPETRRMVQSRENEIATLKTRLAQAKADKYVEIERATEIEIAKKIGALDAFKEKSSIKLANTIEEAKAKLQKLRTAKDFKASLIDDAVSMVRAIPKELRADFIVRANNVKTPKGLQDLADEIQEGIDKFEKKQAIGELKSEISKVEKENRLGSVRLGKIPSPQREKILELIDNVDTKKLSESKEEDLKSLQEYAKKIAAQLAGNFEKLDDDVDAALRLPNERVRQLLRLSQENVNNMDADDIRLVTQSLQNLIQQAKLKSSLLTQQGYKPIDGAISEIKAEIAPSFSAKRQDKSGKPLETEKGAVKKTLEFADRVARIEDAHLDTIVELSTNPGSEKLRQILDYDLHEGLRRSYETLYEWILKTIPEFERLGFTNLDQLQEKVTVTLGGKKVNITLDELIKLELHSRSADNLKAILKTKGWVIGAAEIDYPEGIDRLGELNEALQVVRNDPMLKGIADWTNKLNPLRAIKLNETSLKLEGYEFAREKTYTSRPRQLPRRVEGSRDISVPPEQQGRYLPRTGGTQRMRLDKWSDDFLPGMESDAFYHGMAIPLRNARIIVSSDAFQTAMRNAGRDAELSSMITILRRIQGVITSKGLLEVFGSKIQRGFTSAALGARVSTIGTQVMSYPAALAEVGVSHARPLMPITSATIERIIDDSALMALRWKGRRIGVEIGQSAAADAFDILFFGHAKKLSNKAMAGMMWGDKQAIGNIYKQLVIPEIIRRSGLSGKNVDIDSWNGVNPDDLPKMTDPESRAFRDAAARRLEYITRRSQPMFDMLDRSVSLSDPNFFVRSFFMFRTALEAQENIGIRALDAYAKSDKGAAAHKKLANDISSVIMSAASVAIWKTGFKWAVRAGITAALAALGIFKFNEPKEKEEVAKGLGIDTLKNFISLNRFGKFIITISEQIANVMVGSGYNWNRETFQSPPLETLEQGVTAIVSIAKVLSDVKLLDEFVEETNKGDVKSNEQFAQKLAKDIVAATKSTFNFGVRITGLPFLAPTQEFINPLLKNTKIKIIREITFDDTDSPQQWSERVYSYYELEKELNQKSKTTRLSENEDNALRSLDRLTSGFDRAADMLRETPEIKDRRQIVEDVTANMDTADYILKDLGIKE